jgi:hypothetical protein
MATPAPAPAPASSNWFDSLVNVALRGAEVYGKVQEVRAASKPNNVTVYRDEEVNPATGQPYGVTATGTAGVAVSKTPAWILPVSIVGGVLVLVLGLGFLTRSSRSKA